ncbi:MAG: ferrochelatase [Acidimicrobiales bacterium]
MAEVGVLVMAYGTPERPEDLLDYYTDIRRGRPPSDDQLAHLRARYDAIGGLSPLAALTRAQAAGIQAALDDRHPDRWKVGLGLKHASPRIEDGVAALLKHGVGATVGIVLAPHWSSMSVGQYHGRATDASHGVAYNGIRAWHLEPALINLLGARALTARATLTNADRAQLVVSAHSLPERAVAADNRSGLPSYEDQLRETAAAVAGAAGFAEHRIAFQSAGRTPDPWLGPDLLDVVREIAAEGGTGIVVCPAGFTSDHLEVLYDIDIEAAAIAAEAGIELARTASLNADPAFCALLADLVTNAA